RDEREAGKGDQRLENLRQPGRGVAEVVLLANGEDEGEEDDAVLRPLAGTDRTDQVASLGDNSWDGALGRGPFSERGLGGGERGLIVRHAGRMIAHRGSALKL